MSIETRDLQFAVNGRCILQDITLRFPVARRTAIIGPNGAGKSTLLKSLAALNTDFQGQVLLDGKDIRKFSRKALARKLAILPQGTMAPADISVQDLVEYGRFPYRSMFSRDQQQDLLAVRQAMDAAWVTDFAQRRVADLSGGERQRVFLAMVLAQQPEILLLDEPTTYLDIANQLQVMDIVSELHHKKKITVIMVLHDINHALQYADEVVIMQNGRIRAQGDPHTILTVECLREVFNVHADVFHNDAGRKILFPLSKC
ncbi:ABC transporter ATP-binding protein [Selenomonas ruminantium]|nr:ABC transporter ATP-binding protein [Selenomonas ruminantium]